jgi:hypothetical protein
MRCEVMRRDVMEDEISQLTSTTADCSHSQTESAAALDGHHSPVSVISDLTTWPCQARASTQLHCNDDCTAHDDDGAS